MNNLTNKKAANLTKKGKAVVAIAYAVGTIMAGIFIANCFLDGLEAEGRMRDAQSASYIEALQNKKLQSLDR